MSSDAELVARICEHDESAFEALSARYRESMYRYVLSLLHDSSATEDVVQEVFLRVWTHADQWHRQGSLKAWLLRVATNVALNYLRTLSRHRQQSLEASVDPLEESDLLKTLTNAYKGSTPVQVRENKMGQATRTTKLLLDLDKREEGGTNSGKRAYLEATGAILTQARAFYLDFFLAHSHKRVSYYSEKHLEMRVRAISPNELLTWAETYTVATRGRGGISVSVSLICPLSSGGPRLKTRLGKSVRIFRIS
jgi:RNA polymerase sigma factor (sigma-70 family)